MKKFTPHLLILIVGFLSLAVMVSNVLADHTPFAPEKCEHLHQLSKKLNKQGMTVTKCDICVCEKMETIRFKHSITASVLEQCECDETDDAECEKEHGHPASTTGIVEPRGCVWPEPVKGIPGDSLFILTLTRVVKYCKDGRNHAGDAWPRAGYHTGRWRLVDGLTSAVLGKGTIEGCDGVDPSFDREFGYDPSDRTDHHGSKPGGQVNDPGPDFCEGAGCYIPGWQVGCMKGTMNDVFFYQQCPPPNTYDREEVIDTIVCDGKITQDFPGLEGKQICITPTDNWKLRACYSGTNYIDEEKNPCEQWTDDWSVRLDGVIAIRGCSGGSGGHTN